ncbi:MAG: hypothetical protein ACM3U1_08285 [Chloroflexota bacterium]
MFRILALIICLVLLASCGDKGTFARIDLVNRLIFSPETMQSVFDTSQYNCQYLFPKSFITDLSKEEYRYHENYYAWFPKQKKVDGRLVDDHVEVHYIIVRSAYNSDQFFTFSFLHEDGKWCLRIERSSDLPMYSVPTVPE